MYKTALLAESVIYTFSDPDALKKHHQKPPICLTEANWGLYVPGATDFLITSFRNERFSMHPFWGFAVSYFFCRWS